jgi:hypothetical protein
MTKIPVRDFNRQNNSKDRYTALNAWSSQLGNISRGITGKTGSYNVPETEAQAIDVDMMA